MPENPQWLEIWSEKHRRCYFFSTLTQSSVWQLSSDDVGVVIGVGTAMFDIDIITKPIDVVQGVIDDRRSDSRHPRYSGVHSLHYDPSTGRLYSYDARSQRAMWQVDSAGDVAEEDRPRWLEVWDHVSER